MEKVRYTVLGLGFELIVILFWVFLLYEVENLIRSGLFS